jgi:hypothetical protein
MNLQAARAQAIKVSKEEQCGQHINAHVGRHATRDEYVVTGYSVSDWFDGSTVESYSNGEKC